MLLLSKVFFPGIRVTQYTGSNYIYHAYFLRKHIRLTTMSKNKDEIRYEHIFYKKDNLLDFLYVNYSQHLMMDYSLSEIRFYHWAYTLT